ncbi:MAG: hypothetical protein ACOY4F_01015 [Thermodesulfobacteriota bacterium]
MRLTIPIILAALAGLALSTWIENPTLFLISALLGLLGSCGMALDIIRTRQEYISMGDSLDYGYLTGLQAVVSGLAHLVLAVALIVPVGAWLTGFGRPLLSWMKNHAGLPCMIAGLWLFLNYAGPIIGQAVSSIGMAGDGAAEQAVRFVNAAVEKLISLILCLVGLAMMLLGGVAFMAGKGPVELLLRLL